MSEQPGGQDFVVVTCEHAGRHVPRRHAALFAGHAQLLDSHSGWDPGALALARTLARRLGAPLVTTRVTRLLVDANRSEDHPRAFSELSRGLAPAERERILARHHRPYRRRVLAYVGEAIAAGRTVVHLSAHSFTPVLDGRVRDVDVGFLYDPSRRRERSLVDAWIEALRARLPDLRVRRNRPYLGTSDGLTTTLRGHYPEACYAGIEVEVGQSITLGPERAWADLRRALADVVAATPRGTPSDARRRRPGGSPAGSGRSAR